MQAGGGAFAHHPQPWQRRTALRVRSDAAHVIMGGRCYRNHLAHRIDSAGHAGCIDGGKVIREIRADGGPAIQEHILSGQNLAVNGAGNNVARRQFGVIVYRRHEAFAARIDQHRAFTAQRFGCQRRGITPTGNCGGMKLHEFRIGNHRPGARRHAQAFAARFQRIGGDGIECAQAAGGQHDGTGAEQDQPGIRAQT